MLAYSNSTFYAIALLEFNRKLGVNDLREIVKSHVKALGLYYNFMKNFRWAYKRG